MEEVRVQDAVSLTSALSKKGTSLPPVSTNPTVHQLKQTEAEKPFEKLSWSNDYRRLKNSVGKKSTGGRNNMGRITAYHRGGGNKRRYRFIDNLSSLTPVWSASCNLKGGAALKDTRIKITGVVKSIERDPNRTALIALIYWSNTLGSANTSVSELWSDYSYILAPAGLKVGDLITSMRNTGLLTPPSGEAGSRESNLTPATLVKDADKNLIPTVGNLYLLKELAVGTIVHNIAGKYIRAAGCSGIIISKTESKDEVIVSLQSGQYKAFVGSTTASIGSLSNPERKAYKYRKAGQKAWLGRRPIVRGVAMNPIDHPHGGGEGKSSGGRPSVTPWGKPTKGKPTRSKAKPRLLKASRPI